MRPILALPLLLLAACQTPREACESQATTELRTIDGLIAETRGNLDRGYAIETEQEVRVTQERCAVELPDGTDGYVECEDTDVIEVERPVAIDLEAERRELDSLLARRDALASQVAARLSACQALPDE